jgi:hypothetical protein
MCQRPIFAKTQSLVANSSRETLQRISIGLSLISLALRVWVFGMLIFINRYQAELNGLSGGSSVAMVGIISALLAAAIFLVAACAHWRFCARRPVTLAVWRQPARFDFAWPEPAVAFAAPS